MRCAAFFCSRDSSSFSVMRAIDRLIAPMSFSGASFWIAAGVGSSI